MSADISALIRRTRDLAKYLRHSYSSSVPARQRPFTKIPSIYDDEPLGPWPEFIMHSFFCIRSEIGTCTPCFYSRIPPVSAPSSQVFDSLLSQIQSVLDNFEESVMKRQTRKVAYPCFVARANSRQAMLGLATTGSILCSTEVPTEYRYEIFKRIVQFGEKNNISLQLLIESHVNDVLLLNQTGELKTLANLLDSVSVVNLLGLESADDFVRNCLYAKGVDRCDFEQAITISRKYGFIPGAFVFIGAHSLTQNEIIQDTLKTLVYLKQLQVVPVLMYAQLQPYTLPHLLQMYGRYTLPDPRTTVPVMEEVLRIFPRDTGLLTDPWFVGMEGGPPSPDEGIFHNPAKISCQRCTEIIYDAQRRLRRTYDSTRYAEAIASIQDCSCRLAFEEWTGEQERASGNLHNRAIGNIEFAESVKEEYVSAMSAIPDKDYLD